MRYLKKCLDLYSVPKANPDSPKKMLLLKNPQFLPKLCQNEVLRVPYLTKFRNDWIKIVDFLIKAYF